MQCRDSTDNIRDKRGVYGSSTCVNRGNRTDGSTSNGGKGSCSIDTSATETKCIDGIVSIWIPAGNISGAAIKCGKAISSLSTNGGKSTANIGCVAIYGDRINSTTCIRIPETDISIDQI
ncbi:hypothetical protein D3C87_1280420 [compost metagenome]